jgi:hypothetical protein
MDCSKRNTFIFAVKVRVGIGSGQKFNSFRPASQRKELKVSG